MNELAVFSAGNALATTIVRQPLLTIDVLGVGHCQGQAAATRRTQEELRMAHAVFVYGKDKVLLYVLLSNDLFKLHNTIRWLGDRVTSHPKLHNAT